MSERNELKILRAHTGLNRQTSMLVSSFIATHWPASGLPRDQVEYMCSTTLPIIRAKRLAAIAAIDCDTRYFSQEQVRHYLRVAKRFGFITKLRSNRYAYPELVSDAALLGVAAVESVDAVTPEEQRVFAGADMLAALLPGPVFFTGDGHYPPARALIDGGAAVTLATNCNPYTSPSHNMQMILSLACRKMNMTIAEALSAVTVNAAYALRRADIGSIELRKTADLIVLAIPDHREIVSNFGLNMVEMTIRAGQVAFRRGSVVWPATQ